MRSKMLSVAIAAGLGFTSFTVLADPATASSQSQSSQQTEIAALKAQLQALQAKVSELESRTDAQSDINVSTGQAVEQVQKQVAQVNVKAADTAKSNDSKIHYRGIDITLGGFLAGESAYRSKDTGDDIGSKYSNIPFAGGTSTTPIGTGGGTATAYPVTNARNDQFFESARQSRISLLAEGNVNEDTKVSGYYEADFLGGAQTANMNESNSFQPRVRQLYSTVDWNAYGLHVLAGQAWSLLTLNAVGITPRSEVPPPTIDAQYVPGFAWARQTQFRITKDWDQKWWLAISAENPQTSGVGAVKGTGAYTSSTATVAAGQLYDEFNTVSLNSIPDIIVKGAADPGWGHYEVFGLSRQFTTRVVPATGIAADTTNATSHGQGFGVGLILPLIPQTLELQASGMTGKGIGRYGSGQLSDVTYSPDGAAHPLKENMVLGTLTWHVSGDFDLYATGGREQQDSYLTTGANGKPFGYGAAVLGYVNSECSDYGSAAADCSGVTRQVSQQALGFWWKFYQGKFGKVQFGTEFSHTSRTLFTDSKGFAPSAEDNMLFTSFRYYPF